MTTTYPKEKTIPKDIFKTPPTINKEGIAKSYPKEKIRTKPIWDESRSMKSCQFISKDTIKVVQSPVPMITEPRDVIVKVTMAALCGSDLHLYHKDIGMDKGDIIGHEGVGIIDEVGSEVKNFKQGDRVIISGVIACGECKFCEEEKFSLCDNTNPSEEMKKEYGKQMSGLFGFSPLSGGYPGCQAEYVRVPIADVNCLKIPDDIPDEQAIFLSDVYCTSWHANELGGVKEGKIVAIWGCGPVGLMAAEFAKHRKARVICVDNVPYRLDMAKSRGCEVIDFSKEDVKKTMEQICPDGPDICIDCVGFRYSQNLLHTVERFLNIETDTPEILSDCIYCVKKGGTVVAIGEYVGLTNHFPIGALMEKSIKWKGGPVFVQKYWKELIKKVKEIDPTFLISHKMPIDKIEEAYRIFDKKEHNALKILIKVWS